MFGLGRRKHEGNGVFPALMTAYVERRRCARAPRSPGGPHGRGPSRRGEPCLDRLLQAVLSGRVCRRVVAHAKLSLPMLSRWAG